MKWTVILALLVMMAGSRASLTENDKETLLFLHNVNRQSLANGKIDGQPSAANMLKLKWSNEAAYIAQAHANKCIFKHDLDRARAFTPYTWVGQNMAFSSVDSLHRQVENWFKEVSRYRYDSNTCNGVCGHYKQMVWASTAYLGCGKAACTVDGDKGFILVCNYAPGGNFKFTKPYRQGTPCSECPKGFRCDDGLCSN